MQYFGFDRPSFAFKTFGFGSSEFSPLELFAGGKQGVWYDPSDKTTLFQDVAGTVPVTKDGDPVALMKDKSGNGNHATQTVSTSRPVYKTDGILHWLDFDGVNDTMIVDITMPQPYTIAVIARVTGEGEQRVYGPTYSQLWRASDGRFISFAGGIFYSSNMVDVGADFYSIAFVKGQESLHNLNGIVSYGNSGNSDMTSLTLFSRGASLYGKGRLYSSVLINKELNNDNLLSLEQYLVNRVGVTL